MRIKERSIAVTINNAACSALTFVTTICKRGLLLRKMTNLLYMERERQTETDRQTERYFLMEFQTCCFFVVGLGSLVLKTSS